MRFTRLNTVKHVYKPEGRLLYTPVTAASPVWIALSLMEIPALALQEYSNISILLLRLTAENFAF
jgi:hypothetical protein